MKLLLAKASTSYAACTYFFYEFLIRNHYK